MAASMEETDVIGLAVAFLVTAGGVMGYIKKRSVPSLVAGIASGGALAYGVQNDRRIALGTSFALFFVMGRRFMATQKLMPAGLVTMLSAFMTMRYYKMVFG